MINTIGFHIKKENKNSDFYYFINENRLGLRIESIIFVCSGIACYLLSKFNIAMIIPLLLALYNCTIIFIEIHKSKFEIKKRTIKYQIEYNINQMFFELKLLVSAMKEKGLPDADIIKWKKYYINRIFDNKSLNTISTVIDDIKTHFYRITLIEFPILKEKDILNFIKKESKQWWNELYPNFQQDLQNNAFSKQRQTKDSGGIDNNSKPVSSNYRLEQNLKALGLPTTTRDLNLIKKRYFELVRTYHPDSKASQSMDKQLINEKIMEINGAYQEIEKMLKQSEVL